VHIRCTDTSNHIYVSQQPVAMQCTVRMADTTCTF